MANFKQHQKLTKAERRIRNRKEYFELMLSYLIQFGVGGSIEPFNSNTNHNKMALAKGHVMRSNSVMSYPPRYTLTERARAMILRGSKHDNQIS